MIYDISQNYFTGKVYPGDPMPSFVYVKSFEKGDASTSTEMTANVHSSTHMDAPIHRIKGGKGIDELPLDVCIGPAEVIRYGNVTRLAETVSKRILFKNCDQIDEATAKLIVEKGILFVGAEGQSIGNRQVHRILLENEVVVLEGAVLSHVPEGQYMLYSPPIKLEGCDGAPCRAVLITAE